MAGKVLLAVFALCHAVEANPIPLKVRLQINAGAKELIARLVETGKASTSRMGNLPPCFSKVDELVQWKQIEGGRLRIPGFPGLRSRFNLCRKDSSASRVDLALSTRVCMHVLIMISPVPLDAGHVEPGPPLNDTWKPGPYVEKSGGYCDTVTALVFKPTSCQLDEFSVERFLQLIEGRRLAFMGCSVTRQHFEYLVGRLRSYRIPEEQNQRTIEYGKLLYPSPKGCAKVIDPSKITDPEKAEEVWEGELTQPCFRQGLNPKQFCYTYNVPGGKGTHAWLCYIYANTDPLSDHNMAAYNALGSRDILVVNTGVHFNLVDNTHDAMIRFVRVMGDAHRERPDRPIFIWRESSAQHFGVTKGGYWPPKEMIRARNALKGVTKDFRCPVSPRA